MVSMCDLSVCLSRWGVELERQGGRHLTLCCYQDIRTHTRAGGVQALPATTNTTIIILLIINTTSLATALDLSVLPSQAELEWLPPKLISCGKV